MRYFFRILSKVEFSRQSFDKYSNIKFNENTLSGVQVDPCGRTDMTKLVVSFLSFAIVMS